MRVYVILVHRDTVMVLLAVLDRSIRNKEPNGGLSAVSIAAR